MVKEITLSSQCWRVLKRLNTGGSLYARRTFPFPHKYILTKPEGGDYSGGISLDTIAALLQYGLVEARQDDAKGDHLTYLLTERGSQTAEAKKLAYDDENAEMFP